jgi:hypothetical protein
MKLCVLCYVLPTRQGNTSISSGWSTLAASSGVEASTSNPPNHVVTTPYLEYLFPEYCTKTAATTTAAAAATCTSTTTSTYTNTNTEENVMRNGNFQLYLGTTQVRPVTALVRRLPALIESYQTVSQVQTAYQLQATALKRLSEKAALVVHASKVNDKKKNSGGYKGKTKLQQSHRENNIFASSRTTGANQNPVASSGDTVAAVHAEHVLQEGAPGVAGRVEAELSIQCPQQEQQPQPQFAADQLSSATDVRSSDQNQAQKSKAWQISDSRKNNNSSNNNNNTSNNKGGKQRRDHTETRSKELSLENQFWADLAKGVFDTDSEGDDAHKGHKTSRNDAQRNRDLREQHRAEFLKKRELLLKQQAQAQAPAQKKQQQHHPEVGSSSNNNNSDSDRVVGQKSKSSGGTLQQQPSAQEAGDGAAPKAPRIVGTDASTFPFGSLPALFAARTVEPAKVATATKEAAVAASKEVKRPTGPRPLMSIASTVTSKLQQEGGTLPRTGGAGSAAGACTGTGADTVTGFAAALSSHAQHDNTNKNSCTIQ